MESCFTKHWSLASRWAFPSLPTRLPFSMVAICFQRDISNRGIFSGKFKNWPPHSVHSKLHSNSTPNRIIESMVFGAVVVGQTAILSSDFTKAKLAALNIFKLIDRKPSNQNRSSSSCEKLTKIDKSTSARSEGNLTFRGLHFHYPSRPDQKILNGLSFSASKGETVALVGSSGCGKSTSIQLLEQFYECSNGKIVSF